MTAFQRYLVDAEEQLETSAFVNDRKFPQYRELAKIVAEVYMLSGSLEINIDGRELSCSAVKDIYRNLTADHIRYVVEKFNSLEYEVRNIKSFLRTMLYNSVFELESSISKEVI